MKKLTAIILALAIILPCVLVGGYAAGRFVTDGLDYGYYRMMDSQSDEEFLLGSLSAKYESNGKPETISELKDTGGVSYGAYQFASRFGVPYDFAQWCVTSGEGITTGYRLITAYSLDGNTYGANFNSEWKKIAEENSDAFLRLQHSYTKTKYYDVMVAKLEKNVPGFDIDNYTIAFKNVIWSRTVQQGVNTDVFTAAFEKLGGFKNQSEDVLIKAVYEQSSLLVDVAPQLGANRIELSSALKLGLSTEIVGKYLYYYCMNTSDIQASVYKRLAINEPADALAMYEQYKNGGSSQPGGNATPSQPEEPDQIPEDPAEAILYYIGEWIEVMAQLIMELLNLFTAMFGSAA